MECSFIHVQFTANNIEVFMHAFLQFVLQDIDGITNVVLVVAVDGRCCYSSSCSCCLQARMELME